MSINTAWITKIRSVYFIPSHRMDILSIAKFAFVLLGLVALHYYNGGNSSASIDDSKLADVQKIVSLITVSDVFKLPRTYYKAYKFYNYRSSLTTAP